MPINATFHGFVESTTDALLLFEACHQGVLPKISRRLQERERGSIRSGTVFIFDEKESGSLANNCTENIFIYRFCNSQELKDGLMVLYGVLLEF